MSESAKILALQIEIRNLKRALSTSEKENRKLMRVNEELKAQVSDLTAALEIWKSNSFKFLDDSIYYFEESEKLKELLTKMESAHASKGDKDVKKNHKNSHITSSQDPDYHATKASNETESGEQVSDELKRAPGGQPGHKGTTIAKPDCATKTIKCTSEHCVICNSPLGDEDIIGQTERYLIELQKMCKEIILYIAMQYVCPKCKHKQTAPFPSYVNGPTSYGPTISALISYLHTYQYLPYERLQALLKDILDIKLSTGTIFNHLKKMKANTDDLFEDIRKYLTYVDYVGADETPFNLRGEKGYAWVHQCADAVYIITSNNRAAKNIYDSFPDGFVNATLGSDRYAAHLNTPARGHQMCLIHLIRELKYIIEATESQWAMKFKTLLYDAIELKTKYEVLQPNDPKAIIIETQCNTLLLEQLDEQTDQLAITFQNSMKKNRGFIFPFLYNKNTPFHNNAAERAIRCFKVKVKISGCFRSDQGAEIYAQLRSIIDTLRLNGFEIISNLENLAYHSF